MLSVRKNVISGFTLIELLVVIAVIGVLAGAVVVIINPAAQLARARDAKRKSDIHAIKQALEEHLVIKGSYPVITADLVSGDFSDRGTFYQPGYAGGLYAALVSGGYLKSVPIDPKNNYASWTARQIWLYHYQETGGGTGYILEANLENKSDTQINNPSGLFDYRFTN